MADNKLYYGDNLDILRRYVHDETVDLVYLDPPFNSNAGYNVLFAEQDGARAAAQIQAFDDTWRWDSKAAQTYEETVEAGGHVSRALQAFRTFLGETDMLAYLTMMAPRLVELRRAMKRTGSIYLHCDPTASHYLKMLLDAVFGAANFANELIWQRTTTKNDYKQGAVNWPRVHDTILMFHRDTAAAREAGRFTQLFEPYREEYIDTFYSFKDPDGRRYRLSDITAPGQGSRGHPQFEFLGVTRYWRYNKEKLERLHKEGRIEFRPNGMVPRLKVYLDEAPGIAMGDVWTNIRGMFNFGKEMLGYPTQKPEALLERIINTSSREGDVVLDPFCGCGTAIAVSQRLNRRWIGIDITHLAINLIKIRLKDAYGAVVSYDVVGEPVSAPDAKELAEKDPYQFQWWALGLVGARPVEGKKGADKGIDGRLYFHDQPEGGQTRQAIISVKAGHVTVSHVRDLRGVVEREQAQIGVLISMEEPTKPMRTEAAGAGFYTSPWGRHPKLQLLTIEELLSGKQIDMPRVDIRTFKKAARARKTSSESALPFEGPQP